MPTKIPRQNRLCAEGHRMVFRTIPIVGMENATILGCVVDSCKQGAVRRLKEIAEEHGIDTTGS